MDPFLQSWVKTRIEDGTPLPLVSLWLDGGTVVVGHVVPDDQFVSHAEVVTEGPLVQYARPPFDGRYVTIWNPLVMTVSAQQINYPFLRVDLEHVSAWTPGGPVLEEDEDEDDTSES